MEPWTGAQRAFAVNAFYKNGGIFVIAQRVFRTGKKVWQKTLFTLSRSRSARVT